MMAAELVEQLTRGISLGTIKPSDEIVVRNPDVSEDAMDAGSDGYHELDEILKPQDGRVIFLGVS